MTKIKCFITAYKPMVNQKIVLFFGLVCICVSLSSCTSLNISDIEYQNDGKLRKAKLTVTVTKMSDDEFEGCEDCEDYIKYRIFSP